MFNKIMAGLAAVLMALLAVAFALLFVTNLGMWGVSFYWYGQWWGGAGVMATFCTPLISGIAFPFIYWSRLGFDGWVILGLVNLLMTVVLPVGGLIASELGWIES